MNGSAVTEGSRFARRALAVAVLVHVVEQPADVLAGQVALERPRGVRVAEREGQVRHAAEHHALVGHRLGELDVAAVDGELHAAERQQVEAGGGDDQVGLELGAGRELEARLGEASRSGR